MRFVLFLNSVARYDYIYNNIIIVNIIMYYYFDSMPKQKQSRSTQTQTRAVRCPDCKIDIALLHGVRVIICGNYLFIHSTYSSYIYINIFFFVAEG